MRLQRKVVLVVVLLEIARQKLLSTNKLPGGGGGAPRSKTGKKRKKEKRSSKSTSWHYHQPASQTDTASLATHQILMSPPSVLSLLFLWLAVVEPPPTNVLWSVINLNLNLQAQLTSQTPNMFYWVEEGKKKAGRKKKTQRHDQI